MPKRVLPLCRHSWLHDLITLFPELLCLCLHTHIHACICWFRWLDSPHSLTKNHLELLLLNASYYANCNPVRITGWAQEGRDVAGYISLSQTPSYIASYFGFLSGFTQKYDTSFIISLHAISHEKSYFLAIGSRRLFHFYFLNGFTVIGSSLSIATKKILRITICIQLISCAR